MPVQVQEQKSLTLILARAFASNLSMPISVHDRTGKIVFYNAAAEAVFGVNFSETGELSAAEWTARFLPEDADGTPVPLEELPVGVALTERRPAHRTVHFTRPDKVRYAAAVTAFPLIGREDELFGAMRIFWNEEVASSRGSRGPNAGRGSRSPSRSTRGCDTPRAAEGLALILAREFASNLAMPIYVADADETLVYFNESAEKIAGRSFAETGEMPVRHWARMLVPRGADGSELSREEMPGGIAYLERRPAHATLRISALDGVEREIATTAFPLFGPDAEFHGIMVIFWEQG